MVCGMSLLGCNDSATAPQERSAPDHAGVARNATTAQRLSNTLARGIALALRNPDVATSVRNALRDSRFHEHKVHLRTLLNQNELLLSEASAAIGISATGFQALVHALPDLEFYLPEASSSYMASGAAILGHGCGRTS